MRGSPGTGRQVKAPRNRLSIRGCKMSMAHSATSASHSTALGSYRLENTHTPRVQAASCAQRCPEHRGRELGMQGWSQASQRLNSSALEPKLCRSGGEHFMVKYAERGTKEKAFLA